MQSESSTRLTMSARICKVKPELESLEGRDLMTAGLSSQILAPIQTTQIQKQTIVVFNSPINMNITPNTTISMIRTYEKFSGLRMNHNQTLVRDRGRREKAKPRKR